MPGYNGTGPQGKGPGTGGRRGPCFTGAPSAGRPDEAMGAGRGTAPRGSGRGRSFGGGRGPCFAGRPPEDETVQNLKNKTAALESELAEMRSRLAAYSAKNG